MNAKIERLDREIEKIRDKIAELQKKLRELTLQKTEAENLEIVQMVRAVRMSPQELSALISGKTSDIKPVAEEGGYFNEENN